MNRFHVRQFSLGGLVLASLATLPTLAQASDTATDYVIEIAIAGTESVSIDDATTNVELNAANAYRLELLKMKSQLSVARALLQLRAPGADYHLGRPLQDIFGSIAPELDRRRAPVTQDTLSELAIAVEHDPILALAAVDLAVNAVNGSFAQTGAMDARSVLDLAEALLRSAVAAYAEAVADNEVIDLEGYQRGRGLVNEAEALVRHTSALQGVSAHAELLKVVVLIRQAWPGVMPPPIVFDPASVAERVDQAASLMKELR